MFPCVWRVGVDVVWLVHGAQKVIAEEEVLQIQVQINKNLEEMKKCNSKKDARLKLEKEIAKT